MDKIVPFDWQQQKIDLVAEIFKSSSVAFDMSDTGTGKTVTALGILKALNKPAVVVAPKKVHTSWKRTAEAMGVSHLLIDVVNAERLQYKNNWFKMEGKWRKERGEWVGKGMWLVPADAMLIIDEVHRGCSGPKTKTTRIMSCSKAQKIPVLAMSATMADNPLKMRFIGYLAGLHMYNQASFYGWCRKNGCFEMPGIRGLHFSKGQRGSDHMAAIHKEISDISVRTRAEDVPGFPESIVQPKLYDLDGKSLGMMVSAYAELAKLLEAHTPLTEMLRARQKVELIKVPLLAELAIESMDEGRAPVIFVNFRDTLFKLKSVLEGMNYGVGKVIGGESADDDIDAFSADKLDAMICMTSGGFGISLHATEGMRPRESFISPSYNAVDMKQNLGRIRRINGSKVVQTFVLIANTIEEKIHDAIMRKARNIASLNGDDLLGL
jgi:hypothetical protein